MQSVKDNDFISEESRDAYISAITVLGDREDQQDCFGYIIKDNAIYLAVCDGMGGYSGGKLASTVAVKAFLDYFSQDTEIGLDYDSLTQSTIFANSAVYNLANDGMRGGSTLVSVIIRDKALYWNSVGDSRAYLFRGGSFVQFTTDQNYRAVLDEKKKAGLIDDVEYENELTRGDALICHLGLESVGLIDYNDSPLMLLPDDIVILMSDGLYKVLTDEEISTVLSNFNDINEALYALELKVRKISKEKNIQRDNMTVATVKIK